MEKDELGGDKVQASLPGQAGGRTAGRITHHTSASLLDRHFWRPRLDKASFFQNTKHLRRLRKTKQNIQKSTRALSVSGRPVFDKYGFLRLSWVHELGPVNYLFRAEPVCGFQLPPATPQALVGGRSHWPWVTCPAAWSSRLGVSPMPASSADLCVSRWRT